MQICRLNKTTVKKLIVYFLYNLKAVYTYLHYGTCT